MDLLSDFINYIGINFKFLFQGFKVAYVVFVHTSGLDNALSLKCTEKEPFILSTLAAPITNVVKRK